MADIVCIGAAHLDHLARCKDRFRLGQSNPVTIETRTGGAACNVAMNLARLGVRVGLVSVAGRDAAGDRLAAALSGAGIDSGGLLCAEGAVTATYTALLDPGGEVAFGLADMDIYETLTAGAVRGALAKLGRETGAGHQVFLDANLPEATLQELSAGFAAQGARVAAGTVSPAKAHRLRSSLRCIDLLFTNDAELAALTGSDTPLNAGLPGDTATVFVTHGEKGVSRYRAGRARHLPALAVEVVDVNGAGDAFAAGVLFARSQAEDDDVSALTGLAAASLAVETPGAISPQLSPGTLAQRIKKLV